MSKKPARAITLTQEHNWKKYAKYKPEGYFSLETDDLGEVPVRLFLTEQLLTEAEPTLYKQIVNAASFPGAKLVAITPDTHYGYGVPVGCVILTEREGGAVAMGPVGFDIGCGMMSARSKVPAERATPDRKLDFNREVMERVQMGAGGSSVKYGALPEKEFEELIRGGAEHYVSKYGALFDRSHAERHRIPVEDTWDVPWGGPGNPERGRAQLGSLGGGNHFIELQRSEQTGTLFVQVHTGSRGFGHGLATNYFQMAKAEKPHEIKDIDLGFFTPESEHYKDYLNAVAAGGNFAIVNRLVIFEQVAEAFRKVFKEDLELVYEISHNLVQAEEHPEFGPVWVHRKGATRAFPANHPALVGTQWESTGHPVLIPGSNRDWSYILRPLEGASRSGYSVNHGAGRRLSRGEAIRKLSQEKVNEQYRRDGILVNLDGEVPLDESSHCYKSCDEVVSAVVQAGLAQVEHQLWPLSSLKGTEEGGASAKKRDRKKEQKKRERERSEGRKSKDHYLARARPRMDSQPTQQDITRRRVLRLVVITVFLDLIGFGLVIPLLPLYVTTMGGTAQQVGFIVSLFAAAQFLATPILGKMSDKYGRRAVILWSLTFNAISMCIFALATWTNTLWLGFLSRILAGATAGNLSACQAAIADVSTCEADRSAGMGKIGAGIGIGLIVGPLLGAYASGVGSWFPPVAASALVILDAVLVALWFPNTKPAAADPGKKKEGAMSVALKDHRVLMLLAAAFLCFLALSNLQGTFALFSKEKFSFNEKEVGKMFALYGVLAVTIQGVLLGRLTSKFGEKALLVAGSLFSAIGMGLVSSSASLELYLAGYVFFAIGTSIVIPVTSSMMAVFAPKGQEGAVLGLSQSAGGLGRAVGPTWGGFLYGHVGISWPFISATVTGALCTIIGVALWLTTMNTPKIQER